jgi:peptide/nickel transport system substrate-binding protein
MAWFRLLGPVGVDVDGRPLPLRGPKQRALLGLLLLQPGEAVSRDRLIDGLWGSEGPGDVEHALDAQLSALRRVLVVAGEQRLVRQAPGYLLRVGPDELDATRFRHLVAEGRCLLSDHHEQQAAERLRKALGLWRGPALADVLDAPFAGSAAVELEERRLQAFEDCFDAEIALGRGAELVDELSGLVQRNPLRERLLADLALVLYRAGQQARSLETLASARRSFVDELGVEPGAPIRDLEQRILRQDVALLPSPRPSPDLPVERTATQPRGPTEPPLSAAPLSTAPPSATDHPIGVRGPPTDSSVRPDRTRGRRRITRTAALVAGVAVIAAALLVGDAPEQRSLPVPETAAVLALDPSSGEVSRTVELAATPVALVAEGDGLWAAEPDENVLARVDDSANSEPAQAENIPIPSGPGSVAAGDGAVWVTGMLSGTVSRLDPRTRRVTQTITVGGKPSSVTYDGRRVWVAEPIGRRLMRIDPASGRVERTITLSDRPSSIVADQHAVWVANPSGTVTSVDPKSATVLTTVRVGGGPTAVALGAGGVWVANSFDSTVSRLDARTGQLQATIPVGNGPTDITYAEGAVWVTSQFARTVSRIDPARNQVSRTVQLRVPPMSLASAGDSLWVGTAADGSRHRGGTVTLLGVQPPEAVDPALTTELFPPQFLGLAYDGLTAFQQVSGPDGMQLAPDLAEALPTPAASGTVYTFRLRPGMRYSTGEPVRASDFRRAIERLFVIGSSSVVNFDGLIGADTCRPGAGSCSLPRGVVTDDQLGTVEFRLSAPDADLPVWLALPSAAPVPAGTSTASTGGNVPGTGPYRIASTSSRRVRFERNPMFREWSPLAHPDGIPDTIVWRFGDTPADQVRAVEAGTADWTASGVPAEMLAEVRNHHAGRLRVSDLTQTDFLLLNTRVPPFDDVRVRQAFNLALDRAAVVAAYGGPELARATCQVLPPGSTGRRPYCPYTLNPVADGRWTAPDLARARQLVAASGSAGSPVVVLAGYPLPSAVNDVLGRALTQLGFSVTVRTTDPTDPFSDQVRETAQARFTSWTSPLPAAFFDDFVACTGQQLNGWSCDRGLDRVIGQAHELEATDPVRSDALWATVDRRVVDEALWVPLVNPSSVELVSGRVRGFRNNPLFGFSPAQAWVN